MTKEEKLITEDIIKSAQELREKVDKLCQRGACEWCPLDNVEDCDNFRQLASMQYDEELEQFQ